MRSTESPSYRRRKRLRGRAVVALLILTIGSAAIWYLTADHYVPSIPPPAPLPVPNALDTYLRAAQTLDKSGILQIAYPNRLWNPPSPQGETIAVTQARPLLDSLQTAFKQSCRMPRPPDMNGAGYAYNVTRLRHLLWAVADVRERQGDFEGEFDAALDMVHIGTDLERGGMLIHSLSAGTLHMRAQRLMGRAIDHLTAEECDRVYTRLAGLVRSRPRLSEILREQKYVTLSEFMKMSGTEAYGDWSIGRWRVPIPLAIRRPVDGMRWSAHRSRVLRQCVSYFDSMVPRADLPPFQRPPTAFHPEGIVRSFDCAYLLPWRDVTDVRNRLFLCALRIRAFHLRRSRLPSNLTEAGIPTDWILDPYSGQPFVYRPFGKDFLLYSIGPDGRDDGGRSVDAIDPPNDAGRGDIGLAPYLSWMSRGYNPFAQPVPHMLSPAPAKPPSR